MIPSEVLKRIRKIEIKTRRIVSSSMSGEYHSSFKGRGINFAEVREYAPGDEIRFIDWNVTAKMDKPFVKVFDEERELVVYLVVDISGSGQFGSQDILKCDLLAELAAVLGFSATSNNDKVGLVLFSDQVESYTVPKKGRQQMMRILRDIFYFQPKSKKTNISNALEFVQKIAKKKGIVFLISDFMDQNYEKNMQLLAKSHDLVPICIEDPREYHIPKSGVVLLEDAETGEELYLDTSSKRVRETFSTIAMARKLEQDRFFSSLGLSPIRIRAGEPFIKPLMTYFKARKH